MKKVLHIISSKQWRGGEQQVDYLLNNHTSDIETFLFCPENSALSIKNKKAYTYKKRSGAGLLAAWTLKKIVRDKSINLLHIHDSHALNMYWIAYFLGMKIPVVVHRHVNFSITNKWKYQHPGIQKIIAVSDVVKNGLSFLDPNKLVVLAPCIDVKKYTAKNSYNSIKNELHLSESTILIGIVAALEKEKNIDEFISIAQHVLKKHTNITFVIIGSGSLQKKYEAQIAQLNLINKIHLLGFREDLAAILAGLDLFLFTSLQEGFPLVLLEAMAARVPIISTHSGGIQNMICNNENGLLYTSGNINAASDHIHILLNDPALRERLTEQAFHYVQQFDVPLSVQKLTNVYLSIP